MRRTSSTIPFGYELSEADKSLLIAIPDQIEALDETKTLVKDKVLSLREATTWLEYKPGRKLSPVGLKKIIDNE